MSMVLYIFLGLCIVAAFDPKWRATALILAVATSINIALLPTFISAAEVGDEALPLVYGITDWIVATILLAWGSKGRLLQAAIIFLGVVVNILLLTDVWVYPFYEELIFALNIAQMIIISGGVYGVATGLYQRIRGRGYSHISGR